MRLHINAHHIKCGALTFPCTVGITGLKPYTEKSDWDKATPTGIFPIRYGLYRPDLMQKPVTNGLQIKPILHGMQWDCRVKSPTYNTLIRHPKRLNQRGLHIDVQNYKPFRLFDLILVLGINDNPIETGKASGVFIHVGRPVLRQSYGCVHMYKQHLLQVTQKLTAASSVCIHRF